MDELRIPFEGHNTLCGPQAADNPDGADYLRVITPDGRQLALTTTGKVRAAAEAEITRIMDALTGGRAPDTGPLADPEWGHPECVLAAPNGLRLHIAAAGSEVDYLRICHPDGSEMVYWSCDEWAEDPELVLGAFLGSLIGADDLLAD